MYFAVIKFLIFQNSAPECSNKAFPRVHNLQLCSFQAINEVATFHIVYTTTYIQLYVTCIYVLVINADCHNCNIS